MPVLANKARMVAIQLKEKATADASQQRTLADSEFYIAQKKAEAETCQITKLRYVPVPRPSDSGSPAGRCWRGRLW